ncbi:MAG: MurR/RpiR family transcriptional regulator [Saccharopolyspora sp.]|uniref:MurR/RpiR family transcriptional regulator n=1 Tax=Saccharopolyspora sp. TaxID=33915 RepID=UPI0025E9E143|nr:MurR/RpiR family transcriptional regulator [Saccharopolyspora sp.]MBQ6642393.1 MurR/RpiR family transcriptional regulator [Saccharopolyspora sp.]
MANPAPARTDLEARTGLKMVGPITARIRSLRPSLSPTGARIGDAVLAAPADIVRLTVSELADHTGSSVGSVVRFCQDLDLKGFHDLKLRLAAEATPADAAHNADSPAHTIDTVLGNAVTGLQQLSAVLDRSDLVEVATRLHRAEHVLIAGVGTSAPIAADTGHRLRTCGIHAEVLADPHQQHLAARMLTNDGCCFAISHTGQTQETLTTLRAAHDAGATTIGLTSFHRSPLTELCDHAIVAGASELHGLEATTSRLVHLTVVDVLVALVTDQDPAAAAAAEQLYTDAVAAHRV